MISSICALVCKVVGTKNCKCKTKKKVTRKATSKRTKRRK